MHMLIIKKIHYFLLYCDASPDQYWTWNHQGTEQAQKAGLSESLTYFFLMMMVILYVGTQKLFIRKSLRILALLIRRRPLKKFTIYYFLRLLYKWNIRYPCCQSTHIYEIMKLTFYLILFENHIVLLWI